MHHVDYTGYNLIPAGLMLTALPLRANTEQQREPSEAPGVLEKGLTLGAAPLPPRAPRTSAPGQSRLAGVRDRGILTALVMGSAV